MCNQTTYQTDRQKIGGQLRTSRTATQYFDHFSHAGKLFSQQLLRRQRNCSQTDKKENKIFPRFTFLKISLSNIHLAHLLLPHFIFSGLAKAKEPNFPCGQGKLLTILLLFGTSIFNQTIGQTENEFTNISKNTVYFELLGNGGIYSLKYDRIILAKKIFKISGSIGVSYIPPSIRYNHTFTYPTEINLMYGKRNYLEVGIGFTPVFNLYKEDIFKIYDIYSYPVLRIGYRLQKPNGGFFFKTGLLIYCAKNEFTTDYSNYSNSKTWLGLGFGYAFKNKNQKR